MPFEKIKRQRFRLLLKVYEISKASTNKRIDVKDIINSLSDIKQETVYSIVDYLREEGLLKIWTWSPSRGIYSNDSLSIAHNGIKEIEEAIYNPQNPTPHFPANIYNSVTNYIDSSIKMGDTFQGIQESTIIKDAVVQNAFNKVEKEYDVDTKMALEKIAEFIENSNNHAALSLFKDFNKEITAAQPEKSKLKSLFEGIKTILPDIATISTSIAKITPIFI